MANLAGELNSLDFASLIGGPLQAAVAAQNSASLAQVDFIKSVGMKEVGTGNDKHLELNYVEFTYEQREQTTGGTNNTSPVIYTMRAPLIAMLNIPSIRIEEMTIDFNAKLTSVETADSSSTVGASISAGFSYAKMVNLKASASYQKTTNTGSEVSKSYSMHVHVKVVNDDMPAGLERIMSLIEGQTSLNTNE